MRTKINIWLLILMLGSFGDPCGLYGFTIRYAICSSDANPTYLQFWPLFAKMWKQVIGIEPVLALVADKTVVVDKTVGKVIRFHPLPGVEDGRYAQCIRLLVPALFENDVCIVSDIDMIPLSKEFFTDPVKNISEDRFVVYHDQVYSPARKRIPMCYSAGKGALFKSIFKVHSARDIPQIVSGWWRACKRNSFDEEMFYTCLTSWEYYKTHCVGLGNDRAAVKLHRIDRACWGYDPDLVKAHFYHDAHLPRPMRCHYDQIKALVQLYGISLKRPSK